MPIFPANDFSLIYLIRRLKLFSLCPRVPKFSINGVTPPSIWHLHYYIWCLQFHTPWGKFIWTNIYRNNRANHTKPHCISPTFTPLLIHISPALPVILLLFTLSYFYVYYLSFYIYYLKHQVVLYSYIRLVFDSGH